MRERGGVSGGGVGSSGVLPKVGTRWRVGEDLAFLSWEAPQAAPRAGG